MHTTTPAIEPFILQQVAHHRRIVSQFDFVVAAKADFEVD